jgi:hypothetical protein
MSLNENRTTFTFNHADQVDEYGASVGNFDTVQTNFDSRAEQNLTDINNIKTTLASETVDDSGAHNVKSAGIAGILSGAAASIHAMLSALKSYVDTAQMGQIPDGSLTDTKLSNTAGQIKDTVATHFDETTTTATQPHGLAKNKLDATAAPAVTDDSGDGYGINSIWADVTNDKVYICVDATEGAAVWKDITSSSYSEGAWTPTLYGATTAGTHTYASQLGSYVKINKFITCWGQITLSAKDPAMAGNVRIGGLPFIAENSGVQGVVQFGFINNLDFGTGEMYLTGYAASNTQYCVLLFTKDNTAAAQVQPTAIQATTTLVFCVQYRSVT